MVFTLLFRDLGRPVAGGSHREAMTVLEHSIRDHGRYRGLVRPLVATHAEGSALIGDHVHGVCEAKPEGVDDLTAFVGGRIRRLYGLRDLPDRALVWSRRRYWRWLGSTAPRTGMALDGLPRPLNPKPPAGWRLVLGSPALTVRGAMGLAGAYVLKAEIPAGRTIAGVRGAGCKPYRATREAAE